MTGRHLTDCQRKLYMKLRGKRRDGSKRQPIPALLFRVQVGLVCEGLKFHGSSAPSALLRWSFAMRSITAV